MEPEALAQLPALTAEELGELQYALALREQELSDQGTPRALLVVKSLQTAIAETLHSMVGDVLVRDWKEKYLVTKKQAREELGLPIRRG